MVQRDAMKDPLADPLTDPLVKQGGGSGRKSARKSVEREAELSASLHAKLLGRMAELEARFEAHAVPAELRATWSRLMAVLRQHMAAEETDLYPQILSCPAEGELADALTTMSAEHAEIHRLLELLRGGADDFGALRGDTLSVLAEVEEHARVEDKLLTPCAS